MTPRGVAVRCAGLGFEYGARWVLRGVDLELRAGELTAILGRNGVGKSTLLRLMGGLLAPAAGSVELFGEELSALDRRRVAQKVALVSQEGSSEGGFTVLESVLLGRAPHQDRFGFDSRADLDSARQALAEVELSALADRPLFTLSGGERRRAKFARALAQEPQLLLLDEPTAFLDLGHQVQILRLSRDRARAGASVVAVLHDPNLAASYADRVVVIDAEGHARMGSALEMLQPNLLSNLYGLELAEARSAQIDHPIFAPASRAGPRTPSH